MGAGVVRAVAKRLTGQAKHLGVAITLAGQDRTVQLEGTYNIT